VSGTMQKQDLFITAYWMLQSTACCAGHNENHHATTCSHYTSKFNGRQARNPAANVQEAEASLGL
jgi:hypothetical protein